MNAIAIPPVRAHRVLSAVAAGAASVALTFGTILPTATAASTAQRQPANTSPSYCALLAGASPGSPAAFRLAETIADLGQGCSDPPGCGLLLGATPGSAAYFRIAATLADLGRKC
jgi:hypothetical protein